MNRFEADVQRCVLAFASRVADLARNAAHDMAIRALETADADQPHVADRRSPEAQDDTPAPRRALRLGLPRAIDEFERACIAAALDERQSISGAAKQLRIARTTLQRKMRRMKLEMPRSRTRR